MTSFLEQTEARLAALKVELEALGTDETSAARAQEIARERQTLWDACRTLAPADKVYLARHPARPGVVDYVNALFTDFFEQQGDGLFREDGSIFGGIALYKGQPVTVIGHRKGKNFEENMRCNFGMPSPEGYRKALRLMQAAEKFRRPIITLIDTPGAYPGLAAEEHGQGAAIAHCLAAMSALTVPVVSVVTGEGGSGGALALGVANTVLMLEHAAYSVLSPEGFASILWKDAGRADEACRVMKLTAQDLLQLGVVDGIIPEPLGGAHRNLDGMVDNLNLALERELGAACKLADPAQHRFNKYRKMGSQFLQPTGKEHP